MISSHTVWKLSNHLSGSCNLTPPKCLCRTSPLYQSSSIKGQEVEFPCDTDDVIRQSRLIKLGPQSGTQVCVLVHMWLCAPLLCSRTVSAAAAVWSQGILLCGSAARCAVVWDIWPRPSSCQRRQQKKKKERKKDFSLVFWNAHQCYCVLKKCVNDFKC